MWQLNQITRSNGKSDIKKLCTKIKYNVYINTILIYKRLIKTILSPKIKKNNVFKNNFELKTVYIEFYHDYKNVHYEITMTITNYNVAENHITTYVKSG